MVNFFVYDIILLIVFASLVSIFLYTRKKNLKKEGLLILYKTGWGIRFIKSFTKKNKKLVKFSGYVSVIVGYLLMITMLYFFFKIIGIYLFNPDIVRAIKIPPIMPLIPYLPKVFNLGFLPPFYFIYWIIIIAIVAIPHEFAHGIYAALNKVRIKSTGFGFFPFFLPVFLAAFVEQDDKQMIKKKKFDQMVILSGGAFANVLTAIFFLVVLWIFFSFSFAPAGISFDTYSYSIVNTSDLTAVNGAALENTSYDYVMSLLNPGLLNDVEAGNQKYFLSKEIFSYEQNRQAYEREGKILLYNNAPAIRNQLIGAISKVNEVTITDKNVLSTELSKYSPNESITIEMFDGESYYEKEIVLAEGEDGRALLGIGFFEKEGPGLLNRIVLMATFFKKQGVYYAPKFFYSTFFYNLLWWLILICISVALVNMLPVGIFDGGRFFYLTILGLTKSDKIAKRAFATVTYLFLLVLFLIMVFWVKSFI